MGKGETAVGLNSRRQRRSHLATQTVSTKFHLACNVKQNTQSGFRFMEHTALSRSELQRVQAHSYETLTDLCCHEVSWT
jgi:hypothetical protein